MSIPLMKRAAAIALAAATCLAGSAVQGADSEPHLVQQLRGLAASRGIDADQLLEARVEPLDIRVGELLLAIDDLPNRHAEGSGIAGTGEMQAGDILHVAINVGFDIPRIYEVTSSSAPATPPAVVPIPGTVVPGQTFFEYGGSLRQVRGGGYGFGFHVAGGAQTNVDTAPSGSTVPIFASSLNAGVVTDTSIDFTGHIGAIVNDLVCVDTLCIAIGYLLADGLAFYDDHVVEGIDRPATPTVP